MVYFPFAGMLFLATLFLSSSLVYGWLAWRMMLSGNELMRGLRATANGPVADILY